MATEPERTQLTLDFEGGLLRQHHNLLDVVATGTYRHGLKRVAAAIDKAPSNLSMMLSGQRHFPISELEAWIVETGNLTPIYYLIERFLGERRPQSDAAIEQLRGLLPALQTALEQVTKR